MLWDYNTANQAGLAGPQTAQVAPTGGDPGLWYDNSKQWDTSNPLAGVKPLTGLKYVPERQYMAKNASDEMETFTDPAYVLSSNGTRLPATQNADGTISFSDTYDDPGGKSEKDKLDASYTMDPKTGTAVPTSAIHRYQASDWVQTGQPIATIVAAMAAAYAGGVGLAGAGAGGGAGAGVAGGSAATGNMALIESGLSTAGYGASSAGTIAAGDVAATGAAGGLADAAVPSGTTATTSAPSTTGLSDALTQAGGTSADKAALYGNTGYTGSAGGTGSTIGDMAKAAGQTVSDFLKTPAGQKAAIMLATTAVGAATAPDGPTPGGTTAGGTTVAGIAGKQEGLADTLNARNTALQQQYDPLYAQLIQSNLGQQTQNAALGKTLTDSYQTDFAPLATKMATTAANYDTPERRQAAADAAIAGVGQQYTAARRTLNSNLASTGSGVDPSSGLSQSLNAASRLEEAKASAGAGTTARKGVETTGIGLVSDAAKFGLNEAQTGITASTASTAAGNNAAGLATQQQNQGDANATTVSGLFSNTVNSTGVKANIDNGLFNQQQTAYNNDNAKTADYLSAAGQVAGYIWSSKELKDEVGDVDPEEAAVAVARTPIKAWRYKKGTGLGDEVRIGKYAEDSQAATGLGDGTKLDVASENGLNQAALQYLISKEAKRDPKLRARLGAMAKKGGGLSDARRGA